MKRQSKLTPREEHALSEQSSQQHAGYEFNSVEQMLREDARQTPVPPQIAGKLQRSIDSLPRSKPGLFRRLFGK